MEEDSNYSFPNIKLNKNMKGEIMKRLKEEAKEARAKATLAELEAKRAAYNGEEDPGSSDYGLMGAQGDSGGGIDIEANAGYYAEICAYNAMKEAVKEISDRISKENTSTNKVIVVKDENFPDRAALWHNINTRIDISLKNIGSLLEEAEDLLKEPKDEEPKTPVLTTVKEILGSLAEIAKYFKADFALKSKTIEVNEQALIAEIAGNLTEKKKEVVLPGFSISPGLILSGKITELQEEKVDCQLTKNKIDKLLKENPNHSHKERLEEISTEMGVLVKGLDEFINYLTAKPDKGLSPIETIFEIDRIMSISDALVLSVFIASKGADIETYRHIIWNNKIFYNGGIVIGYFLTEQSGKCLKAGTKIAFNSEEKVANTKIKFEEWVSEKQSNPNS